MRTLTRSIGIAVPLLSVLVALQACDRTPQVQLPEGPQTITGTLLPAPLSLSRRGTHVVRVEGADVYYAESTAVNLREYERMDVGLTGTLERNIDPDALPVLIVSGVSQQSFAMRRWSVPSPRMSLSAPESWTMRSFDDGVQFTQTGSTAVFLRIYPSTLTQLPAGTSLRVAGLRAARIDTASGSTVHVQNNRSIVTLSYHAVSGNPQEFERILQTISFGQTASSVPAGSLSSGSAASASGNPCGGPAGILCPAGEYCEVTDAQSGIGRCRALKR